MHRNHPFRAHGPDAFHPSAYFNPADPSAFLRPLSLPDVARPLAEQAAANAGLRASLRGHHVQGGQRWSKTVEPEEALGDNPRVTLDSQSLWSEFYKRGTEMVITKSGRYANCREIDDSVGGHTLDVFINLFQLYSAKKCQHDYQFFFLNLLNHRQYHLLDTIILLI